MGKVVHPPLLTRIEAPTRTEANQRTRGCLLPRWLWGRGARYGVMRLWLASLLSAVVAAAAAAVPDTEAAELAAENSMLQLKLKRLEDELQQELKYLSALTRTSRSLRTCGLRHQPPAYRTYLWRWAAAGAPRTYAVRVPASLGVPHIPRTVAPQAGGHGRPIVGHLRAQMGC